MSRGVRGTRIHEHGGLDRIRVERFEVADPGPGEVRVALRAAALNHLDLFVLGGIPGIEIPLPHVLGADGTGVVDAVGEGVEGVAPGDQIVLNPGLWCGTCEFCEAGEHSMCVRYRLLGEHVDGTFAEAVLVPEANCHPKPAGLDWTAAAAFPLAYLTAWRMLITRAGIRAGQTVLIHGVGGGVGLAALQIAVSEGARAFVTSHSDEKLRRAEELGAAAAWNYAKVDIARRVREETGRRGVDIVVDSVGAATFADSIRASCRGGTIVTCGGTSGPDLPVDVRQVFWRHLTIMGSTMGSRSDFSAMTAAVDAGRLHPVVDRVYALDEAADAFRRLQSAEQFGKVVLEIA